MGQITANSNQLSAPNLFREERTFVGKVIEQTKYTCQHRSYCQIYLESNCPGKITDYNTRCEKDGQQLVVQKYIIGKLNGVDYK